MSTYMDDPAYRAFRRQIVSLTGVDLAHYRPAQMMRRIKALMRRHKAKSFLQYAALLCKDKEALAEFVRRTAVAVSQFFRDPERFRELREAVLPELLAQRCPLRIWSAGCSYGAEPYSVAIILAELTPGVTHEILGTDIDERALAQARKAQFSPRDLKGVEPELVSKYFCERNGGFSLRAPYAQGVEFKRHNLMADEYEADHDLILCRNVLIYLTEEAKAHILRGLRESLRPGGYLFLGSAETILNSAEYGLEAARRFFYRKPHLAARAGLSPAA